MQRIPNLIEFCQKTGLLNICSKTKAVVYGPYGQLLLNQIKNEWLRANLNKFETSFLVEAVNLLDEQTTECDLRFYVDSLTNTFEFKKLPISLLNITTTRKDQTSSKNMDYVREISDKETHFYSQSKDVLTHLNAFHFCNDEHLESGEFTDSLTFWQRERKNWWIKLFNCPENVFIDNLSTDYTKISNFNLLYKLNDSKTGSKWLENIKYVDNINETDNSLKLISKKFNADFLLKNTKKLIMTLTTTQNVLESILNDCVQFRRRKSEVLINFKETVEEKDKIVFRLNYRLAPYKACILYENTASDSTEIKNCFKVAHDLRKLFLYHQINVFILPFDSSRESIQDKYDKLDELGMPFSILLNAGHVLKDGVCLVRNRDTTLEEHLHISQVVNQFKSISNALNY